MFFSGVLGSTQKLQVMVLRMLGVLELNYALAFTKRIGRKCDLLNALTENVF